MPAWVGRLRRFDALLLTALIWFLAKFVRLAFPPLFEVFRDTYGVSNTAMGAAYSGMLIVYAVMQFPSGILADRLGSVKIITAGALVASSAALLLIVDSPFLVLATAMVLVGAGTGAHKTVAVRLLSRVYPRRVGRALGVLDTFGTSAGVVAPAAVVVVAGTPSVFGAPWRTLFLVAGIVGLCLSVLFAVIVPGRFRHEPHVTGGADRADVEFREYLALFRGRTFTSFVVVAILVSFGFSGIIAFLPLFMIQEVGLSTAAAGLLYSVLYVVSAVQLLTGEASDRIGSLAVVTTLLAVGTASLVGVVFLAGTGNVLVLGAGVVGIGIGGHGYRPVRDAYLMSVIPESIAGGGLGVVRTCLMVSAAIAPVVVGYLSETVGFRFAFWTLAASMGVATLLVSLLSVAQRSRSVNASGT